MGIRPIVICAALCLGLVGCGPEEGQFEADGDAPEQDVPTLCGDECGDEQEQSNHCSGDDCSDESTGPRAADGTGEHGVSVVPGTVHRPDSEDEIEQEDSADTPAGQAQEEPDAGEGAPQENESATNGAGAQPQGYDLQCADDEAICRFCGPPIEVATSCPSGDTSVECQVLDLVNEKRVDHGLDPLGYDGTLAASAKIHAMDLNHCDFFAHDSLDGTSFFERCADNGYAGTCTGENIGGGQQTPQAVMDAWVASPGHRENILYPHHTHVGVAYYEGSGTYGRYWVKHFGRE